MTDKHTPGPWAYDPFECRINAPEGGPRSMVGRFHLGRDDRGKAAKPIKADALLIATAPEMDALIAEGIDLIDGDLTGIEWKRACREWVRAAKAVRAKARGETI